MAKDQESLDESREIRARLIGKWGRIPTSIWRTDWSVRSSDSSKNYMSQYKASPHWGEENAFCVSGAGARGGAFSRFPQDLCRFMVQFHSPDKLQNATDGHFKNGLATVLDPFCGHNSRMESVWLCNRNYIGFDISKSFMGHNEEVRNELLTHNRGDMFARQAQIELHLMDSRHIADVVPAGIADMVISSPPFYSLEDYGNEPEQLGKLGDYPTFLANLKEVAKGCFLALKPGCKLVWELNDFALNGVFYPYHADGITMLQSVGFKMYDMVICDYGSGFFEIFATSIEQVKRVSKNHSYFIVVEKPGEKKQPVKVQEMRQHLMETLPVVGGLKQKSWLT